MKSLSVCMHVHGVIPDSPIYFEYLLHFGGKKHAMLIRFTRRITVSQARKTVRFHINYARSRQNGKITTSSL